MPSRPAPDDKTAAEIVAEKIVERAFSGRDGHGGKGSGIGARRMEREELSGLLQVAFELGQQAALGQLPVGSCQLGDRGGIYLDGDLVAATAAGAETGVGRLIRCANFCAGVASTDLPAGGLKTLLKRG